MADDQHPLFVATRRLVTALDRLETGLQRALEPGADPRQQKQLDVFEHENEALKAERENLNRAITSLQTQYDDLHDVASAIYGKLDDSIKRLTQIIEH